MFSRMDVLLTHVGNVGGVQGGLPCGAYEWLDCILAMLFLQHLQGNPDDLLVLVTTAGCLVLTVLRRGAVDGVF